MVYMNDNSFRRMLSEWSRAQPTPPANNGSNSSNWALSSPNGSSWNAHLNQNSNGHVFRKMYMPLTETHNVTKNSVVTPLDMYVALLYPSCPVGIDTKTRKKLKNFATRMTTGVPLRKTQRERMEALLKRLVREGGKCGMPHKSHGKKYRLPTKEEMNIMGYKPAANDGRFFHKRPRNPDPVKNPRKAHIKGNASLTMTPPNSKGDPQKRMKLALVKKQYPDAVWNSRTNDVRLNAFYHTALTRKKLDELIYARFKVHMNFTSASDELVGWWYQMASGGNFSFLQGPGGLQ